MYEEVLKQLGNLIFAEDELSEADIILVPGNGFPQMAECAAKLYLAGLAPFVLPSGRYSVTEGKFGGVQAYAEIYDGSYETECAFLCDVLQKNGVPSAAILPEDQATYTYENAIYSRRVTDREGLTIRKAILCCKSHHAGRALLYYQRTFPEAEILVCPVCVDGISRENWRESEAGVEAVIAETGRILRQFEILMR